MAEDISNIETVPEAAKAEIPVAKSMPLLCIDGVVKTFGTVRAVDRLSLDIRSGEFFALLGPSGCGKTTLLRMLAGFETADQGHILLDGKDIAPVLPHQRPVNMMFQNYALFPHLSVRDNIAFGLRRAGMKRSEIDARVAEMVALVRLEGLEQRKPDQLSGGQRQRVALARSLARRPRVLLLDEPLAALDKKLRESTQAELMALQRQLGMTFIIVTHDQEEAMTMADRIGVMKGGRRAGRDPAQPLRSTMFALGCRVRRRHQHLRRRVAARRIRNVLPSRRVMPARSWPRHRPVRRRNHKSASRSAPKR